VEGKSLTHLYYGNGKGKTTAALGLALRASGSGKSVVVVQFLKDWKCGEHSTLTLLPNVSVFYGKSSGGVFIRDMSETDKSETKSIHDENLKRAMALHDDGRCDMLVLDEAIDAYQLGVLDESLLKELLTNKPNSMELVITGHSPDTWMLEYADYVTEMVKHKHPYDCGVSARKGIEF